VRVKAAMKTEEFLKSVLGESGFYCVVGLKPSQDKRIQKFYGSVDEVLHVADNFDANGIDAYFALATFEVDGSRKNDNVKELRSFFLDLDCGPSKDYADQEEAIKGLRKFCKSLSLPRPTIVNSGRGVHVYWPLTEPVSREAWLPVAEKLKHLCHTNNLYADPAVTADSARILRVPGTHNYKDEDPKQVEVVGTPATPISIEAFDALLGEEEVPEPRKFVPKEIDPLTQILAGSYVSVFKNIIVKTAAGKGCQQLGWIFKNQDQVDFNLWRAGLSIAEHCEDRDEAIHKMSRKHPDYSAEYTEKVSAGTKGPNKGPYLCTTFEKFRPEGCDGCPHKGNIRTPISLGRSVAEATDEENIVVQKLVDLPAAPAQQFVIPKYPAPYFRGKGGGIFKRIKLNDDENKEVPIYHNDLYVVRRIRDPELGECAVLRLHLPRDGVREFTVPLTAVGTKDEFRKHLAIQGVAVIKMDELMAYVHQWINDLQTKTIADEARRQFGWTDDDPSKPEGMTCFVLGAMEIYKDHIAVNSPSTKTVDLFPAFVPKGSLEGWKETMEFWNRTGVEAHQYMVGLGFGSVLVPFFENIKGTIFHMFSKDSGLGKTTAMFAGASIWGDPDALVLQERDTYASKMNRAEAYKNIPLYVDEMTNTLPKDLSDFAYQIPGGQQRNRLGARGNTERVRGDPWKLLVGSNGNTSMIERINLYKAMPKAEAQRILEKRAIDITLDKVQTDEFSRNIMRNYGHAGLVYIQYILNNKDAVKQIVLSTQTKLDAAAKLGKENRFWSAQAAAVVSGLMIAKKAGLLNWQVAPLVTWIVNAMNEARDNINGMGGDVESLLTDYLAENYNNILRIKSTDDIRKGSTGLDHLITPEAVPRVSLVARYEYDVKKLYLMPKPLKEWCGKHQVNYSGFIDGLKSGRTKAHRKSVRLGTGTHINLPPIEAWIIDCSGFLTDETEEKIATGAALIETQTMGR